MIPPSRSAIVLYGRAALAGAQGLAALAEVLPSRLRPERQGVRVAWAFADLSGPSLPDVLDALARDGVEEAVVVTCMVPADPTLSTWLAGALSQWSVDCGAPLTVRLAEPVETILDLASAAAAALDGPLADVTRAAPSLGKPGWSRVPEHGRQVAFCVGARCLHRGAEPIYQHLRARMRTHRALTGGPRRVMCARSACLYPCNLGPLMTVHPDGVWYGGLTRERVDRIVTAHFLGDRRVDEAVVHVAAAGPAAPAGITARTERIRDGSE